PLPRSTVFPYTTLFRSTPMLRRWSSRGRHSRPPPLFRTPIMRGGQSGGQEHSRLGEAVARSLAAPVPLARVRGEPLRRRRSVRKPPAQSGNPDVAGSI